MLLNRWCSREGRLAVRVDTLQKWIEKEAGVGTVSVVAARGAPATKP